MRFYICLYRSQKLLVEAHSLYGAKLKAAAILRCSKKQASEISVYLADEPISTATL